MLNKIGKEIPIRELMVFILSLQMLISPLIAYHYFDNDMEFLMFVNEGTYILFILFYIIMFSIGLFIPLAKNTTLGTQYKVLDSINNSKIGLFLIVFGFTSQFVSKFTPSSLQFVFYLFSYSKLIGAIFLIFSQNRFKYLLLAGVFGQFAYTIISGGLFYDLIIWGFFLYMALEIKIKSSFTRKIIFSIIGITSLMFLQSIKSDYRKEIWDNDQQKEVSNFETFIDVANQSSEEREKSNFENLITRLNTGWITSSVMAYVPTFQGFTNGTLLLEDLKSVILPRIIAPNKKSVGGKENRAKFEKFTGRMLGDDTTMRIGVIADAYINFGPLGGGVLMLVFGLVLNLVFKFLRNKFFNSIDYLWLFFIFSFTIRMSDFLVILNSTLKSLIIFFVIKFLIKRFLKSEAEQVREHV